ncbi:hypothetical protein MLD38_005469 [Melastoma candidum]|uniref:Uncharacterized protein n=1 Tax=Melastoma candidum TaxID=119954 RepID=A0ACB9RJR9_9MYRT|nr:hypothetical protein MLD38_005469 [Melastoma candidum]
MLQTQLDVFWSDSIPVLLLSHLLRSLCHFRSLLLYFLPFLHTHPPSLLSPALLRLHSNRSLSRRFDSIRDGTFGSDCAVCMSEMGEGEQVSVLGCRHVYHKGCLDQCIHHHVLSCPLCKRPIPSSSLSPVM